MMGFQGLGQPRRTSKFLQSMHLQLSEQKTPAWKHSQYFLRQPLFLQLQPLLCRVDATSSCSARGRHHLEWQRPAP